MEDGAHPSERYSHSRSAAFAEFRAYGLEHVFNIAPCNVRFNRVGEHRLQRLPVLLAHILAVSYKDTMRNRKFGVSCPPFW